MQFSMLSTQKVSFLVAPVDAAGNLSNATISNLTFTSSDSTIFTVAPDPANALGGIVTGVAAGTATLTAQATATETDGTQNRISGAVTIILSAKAQPAAALVFTFGVPA